MGTRCCELSAPHMEMVEMVEMVEMRKDLAGEDLFCSSTWLQLLHLTLCRSLLIDRAFRLTVSSLLASMSRPVINLTIDLSLVPRPRPERKQV